MKIQLSGPVLLFLAVGTAWPALSPTAHAQRPAQQVSDLNYKLKSLLAEHEAANKRLARVSELYKNGQTPASEVEDAQNKADALSREIQMVQHERDLAGARVAFGRPVTIQLDHASVKQFASALSKATGISVKVDPEVPADATTMLTLDAQGVPFANVLEAIAEKTDLMIEPAESGVILKRWPHLNGQVFRGPIPPWSSEWGVPPTLKAELRQNGFTPAGGRIFGGGSQGLPGAANPFGDGPASPGEFTNPAFGGGQQPPQPGGAAPQGGFFSGQSGPGPGGQFPGGPQFAPGGPGNMQGMAPGLPITMTHLGDRMIAIAEPGMSDCGEPGIWMTAYSFEGNSFHRMGQSFHQFVNGPRPGANAPGQLRPRGPGQQGIRPQAPGAMPGGSRPIPGTPQAAAPRSGAYSAPAAPRAEPSRPPK